MRKTVLWIMIIAIALSMIATFSLSGCKDTAGEEAAGEEPAEEESAEESAEEESAEEEAGGEVVEEMEEYYAHPGGWWGIGVWQNVKYGGQRFAEYFNGMGENIMIEHPGPVGDDIDAVFASLEATLAKDPIGIMWYPLNIGEGEMLQAYHDRGGYIVNWGGTQADYYEYDSLIGTDNINFGNEQAWWALDEMGDSFKVGIMTMTDLQTHIDRTQGVLDVFEDYPNVELVEPLMEQTGTSEGAAANASAYIAANPDVEVYLCTSALGGAAVARAIKEAGYAPGEKMVLASDTDPELIELIDEGYITGSLGQSFAVESFYAFTMIKALYDQATMITKDDAANGIVPIPFKVVTPLHRVTADTTSAWEDMPQPQN